MTGLLMDAISKDHVTGEGHPERPARFDAVATALNEAGHTAAMQRIESRAVTDDEVLTCHTAPYLKMVERDIAVGHQTLSTGDTEIGPKSLEVARRAAGGALNAVDAIFSGKVGNAFCVVRPPGHHATPGRGMGFCIFNNVAVAARYAQKKYGVKRVLIADWDVHHGNGTQDIFYSDGSVFFFSTHQSPWYPGTGPRQETGEGAGKGTTLNCPFAAGSGSAEILGAFRDQLVPKMAEFKPEFIILSAGFDSRAGDPLGRFQLSDEDFAALTATMLELADKHAKGRLLSMLEGGYSLTGLAAAASAHVRALRGGIQSRG
jgi:acetoin utilization deacetylase AcuC-like enzyme